MAVRASNQNNRNPVLLDFKSKAVVRNQLLGDPLSDGNFTGNETVDLDPEHRREMRRKLYGYKGNLAHTKPEVSLNEALSTSATYADEILPFWQSTMKAEFSRKEITPHQLVSREAANNARKTSIYMESPGAPTRMISSTMKDYVVHHKKESDGSVKPFGATSRYASKPAAGHGYSLIQCDEMVAPVPRNAKAKLNEITERTSLEVESTEKGISHISFGNTQNDWQSVSRTSLVSHEMPGRRQQSVYETLEKTKSTVLDNPDLVLEPIQSVHQAEFSISDAIDRTNLTFDTTTSRKALNGTHFTLGNGEEVQTKSEYISSFLQLPHKKTEPLRAVHSSHLAIIAEDYEDRRMGGSSQRHDYLPPQHIAQSNIMEIKKANSRSSIVLGQEGAGFTKEFSLSKGDYRVPASVNPEIASERYRVGGKILDHPKGVPYESLVGMEGTIRGGPMESVNKGDYIIREGRAAAYKDALVIGRVNRKDNLFSHFNLETSENVQRDHQYSVSKDSFINPSSIKVASGPGAGERAGGGGETSTAGDKKVNGFNITIENTVGRYPYNQDNYSTTFSSTFKAPVDYAKRAPYEPSKTNQLNGHLHPQLTCRETENGLEFDHIRELTTVSGRDFVAPELMKEHVRRR